MLRSYSPSVHVNVSVFLPAHVIATFYSLLMLSDNATQDGDYSKPNRRTGSQLQLREHTRKYLMTDFST